MQEDAQAECGRVVFTQSPDSKEQPSWGNWLDASLKQRTLAVVSLLAERMREPEKIVAISEIARGQVRLWFDWQPSSFASGFGSLVLPYLYLARSFPEGGWAGVAQHYTRLTVEGTHQQPLQEAGVFTGTSGMATVLTLLSKDNSRYRKVSRMLEINTATYVLKYPWKRATLEVAVADYDYDIMSGVSGILGYLISTGSQEAVTQDAIGSLLAYLVWLARCENEMERKHWFIPPHLLDKHLLPTSPYGCFNLGLAHGIPGPLAALSLAWQAGYNIEGQREAIRTLGHWVLEQCIHDPWGINWRDTVPWYPSSVVDRHDQRDPSRAGWCYGSPGIARSLWLAGIAVGDDVLCQAAIEAMEAVLRRPLEKRVIDSPTLCHGVSGLLLICMRFAHDTANATIQEHIPLLVKQILEMCDAAYPLGVRNEEIAGNFVDDPGFLTGAAGVLLTLLTAATTIEPTWDRTLLIA